MDLTQEEIIRAMQEIQPGTLVKIVLQEGLLAESMPENAIRVRPTTREIHPQSMECIYRGFPAEGVSEIAQFETKEGYRFDLYCKDLAECKPFDDNIRPKPL